MDRTKADVGTEFDVSIFQNGNPVIISTLVQQKADEVHVSISSYGELDLLSAKEVLELVVSALAELHEMHLGEDNGWAADDNSIPF